MPGDNPYAGFLSAKNWMLNEVPFVLIFFI